MSSRYAALAKKGYLGEVTIRVYGDMYQPKEYYQSAGIKLKRDGDKYERFLRMNQDFFQWRRIDKYDGNIRRSL